MPHRGSALRMIAFSAVPLSLVAIPLALSQSPQPDAAAANSVPSLSGPSFIADGSFRGSTLAGWHSLGQADWRADQGQIIGKGTGAGGFGWLVLDRSFQDTGLYVSFQCVGPCDTGILLRMRPTADGVQGTYLAIKNGDLKAYSLTLDSAGKEIQRKELRSAGGQIRFAPPTPDPSVPPQPIRYPSPPSAPPGVTIPITRPPQGIREGEWNEIELLLDADILRAFMNDGRMDILGAQGWWEQPPPGSGDQLWKYHPVAFGSWERAGPGGSEIGVYDVNGDGLNDIVTSLQAHGWGLAWFEQKRSKDGEITFVKHMVMDNYNTRNAGGVTFSELHGTAIADVDGDGIPDFIVGKRYWSHLDDYFDADPPPGDIRAYDVLTGKMVWIFHTVPHPGEFGYDTWPKNAWKYIGGTNDWGGMTIDEKRGIAYFPLGSPTYDFYGADRTGAGLFGDCLLALDARTGKYLWHFQAVHHDLWDYDLTTAPKLLTVKHDGKMVDIVAQAGKNGFLYVFDRVTGKPIWPIDERPVPQSDMPGEHSWPTQPFPTAPPPFSQQPFTPDDVDPYVSDPAERARIKEELQSARNEGLYTPPGLKNTVEIPGNNGGGNWGGGAVDPPTGTLYIQTKNAPSMLKLEPNPPKRQMTGTPETEGRILYIQNCQACHMAELTGQPPSIPSLAGVVSRIGADRVKSTVQDGASPMPAFTSLSEKEVDALVAYLSDPSKAHVPPDIVAYLSAPRPPPPPTPAGAPPVRYWTGYGYMNSSEGLPANKPPWSTLTAYDLNKGTIRWQIPLGSVTELVAKGVTDTGSYWPRGGVVVTAGGLIFSGSISDATMRAYDKDTGKVLWEKVMPAGPEGIPAVFGVDGREYLAFSARPSLKHIGPAGERNTVEAGPNTPQTQGFYVFALPKPAH